jgi:hypothetical protein
MPITVAVRSKAYTVFARSEPGIVGSNPTQGMDVWCLCVCLFVYRQITCDELITRPRSPADSVLVNWSETESFMVEGQGQNWGYSAKGGGNKNILKTDNGRY